jgi:hypothetical protein
MQEAAARALAATKREEARKEALVDALTAASTSANGMSRADSPTPLRFDEEGVPIYSSESLNIGKGGGTALCPFDCECCF